MTRLEALEQFREEQKEILVQSSGATWEKIENYGERLREAVREGFSLLAEEIEKKKKQDLEYFQFSVLRTDLMEKKYTVLLHGYGKSWYMDKDAAVVSLSLDDWIKDRIPAWEQLYREAKKYMGKVNRYDIDYLMIEQIMEENKLIAHALRFIVRDIEKYPVFAAIPKEIVFQLRYGEYRDKSELIYKADRTKKTQKEWEEAIRRITVEPDHLVYSCWYGAALLGGLLKEQPCHYIRFEESGLKKLEFRQAGLMGARFLNCSLEECDFTGANLQHADFTGSRAEECDFSGADLTHAVFSEQAVPYLHLMPEQLQKIQIVREG